MNPAAADISREDIEAKLKEVAEALNAASRPARQTAFRVGVITAALLVMAAYFLGSAGAAWREPSSNCAATEARGYRTRRAAAGSDPASRHNPRSLRRQHGLVAGRHARLGTARPAPRPVAGRRAGARHHACAGRTSGPRAPRAAAPALNGPHGT